MNFVGLQNYIETLTTDRLFPRSRKKFVDTGRGIGVYPAADRTSSGAGSGTRSKGRTVFPDDIFCAGSHFQYGDRTIVDEDFSQRIRAVKYFS